MYYGVIALMVLFGTAVPAFALEADEYFIVQYNFCFRDPTDAPEPGAPACRLFRTVVSDVNGLGDLVGGSVFGTEPAFLLSRTGARDTVACPGGVLTAPQSINRTSSVVGGCFRDERQVGFHLAQRVYTFLTFPGSRTTTAWGHNDAEVVAGDFTDTNGRQHGYLWRKATGRYRRVDVPFPDATGTRLMGLNNAEAQIGFYSTIDERDRGFLLQKGTFTRLDAPGARHTIPVDIDDTGQIAVIFADPVGLVRSALYRNGEWFLVALPQLPFGAMTDLTSVHGDRLAGRSVVFNEETQGFDSLGFLSRMLPLTPLVAEEPLMLLRASSMTRQVAGDARPWCTAGPLQPAKLAALCESH